MIENSHGSPAPQARVPTTEEYIHERLAAAERFEAALTSYDTCRRVEVLVDRFLAKEPLAGRAVLDVGCGLGYFSRRLVERGAQVTACDIGPGLVEITRRRAGCHAEVADALDLVRHFGRERFDGVVSSECIEHTPDPDRALREMAGVLRPGGFLSLSTPNRLWYPVVRAATLLRLRPFDGHENFNSFGRLGRVLRGCGLVVEREQGLHLWPFQLPLHGASRWADAHLQALRGLMINLCVLARKEP